MLKRTLTHTLVILFMLCCTNALAAKWTVNFEKNLREGNIQKAVQEALKYNAPQSDILTALEKALVNGIVPEAKAPEVEELILLADICNYICGPSEVGECSASTCECDCCANKPPCLPE